MTATGGDGGPLTDRLDVNFSNAGISADYHCYAAGLDWSKSVGICIYMDGSGGFGLDNPTSPYLLGGSSGLVAVAKSHNMLLLVPEAPPPGCPSDNCWYNESTTPNATQKSDWLRALVNLIYSQYNIEKTRVAVGGYSSGAQATTRWFIPRHGAAIMEDGVFVAIAFGGSPRVTGNFPAWFKSEVHGHWDTGTADADAYTTASHGGPGGYNWYTSNGFDTSYNWPSGVGHGRSGEFQVIMDAQITAHVVPTETSVQKPGQPTSVSASPNAADNTKASIYWQPPSTGGAVSNYQVAATAPSWNGGMSWISADLSSSLRSFEFTDLNPATEYTVQVRAKNAAGNSLYVFTTVTTGSIESSPDPPPVPTGITYTVSGTSVTFDNYELLRSDGVVASGGTVTQSASYRYHSFTSSGELLVTEPGTVDVLIVAGGGGGGGSGASGGGGGGGAGGVTVQTMSLSAGAYPVVVGGGGTAGAGGVGSSGSNSSFDVSAAAGGGGGRYWTSDVQGAVGGSGGGATGYAGGAGGSGTPGQGSDGGSSAEYGTGAPGAGGGGKGGIGGSPTGATNDTAGSGGPGHDASIFGRAMVGGGGGGGRGNGTGNIGGGASAGGGDGGTAGAAGSAGTPNTGGGGGGGGSNNMSGGLGGSGIVVVRYAI